ncbi:MAG: hypothetical protein ACTSYC_06660 [Promethearchaeota archaeon]
MVDIQKIRERRNNINNFNNDLERYEISCGCCLFHDSEEFSQFTDIEDEDFLEESY